MAVYLAVVTLGVLAVAGVVVVAVRGGRLREPDSLQALFTDRRRELTREAAAQDLGREELRVLEEELALNHLDESTLNDAPGEAVAGGRVPVVPLLACSAVMLVVAVGLYTVWGEPQAGVLARATEIMRGEDRAEMRSLESALESRLDRVRGDVNAWFLLGHLRMQLADYEEAAAAFAALHGVAGPVVDIDVAWAQARYRADDGKMSTSTRAIVDRVLAERPDHPTMLELLTVDAIHRGDYREVVDYLSRALRQPMPATRRSSLADVLALAQARLADGDAADHLDAGPKTAVGVSVSVSLGVPLEVDSATPVFVIARDPDAPRPPVAVRRLTVGDLPAEIQLSDADAMMPGRGLADLDSVELLARVSLGGSPSARSGDLQSDVTTGAPGGEVALRIEHRVP